jgi:uncharacterized membrane protein YjfL (UPF0719 family)
MTMMEFLNPKILFNSMLYSILGVAVFWISFIVIDKLTPYSLWTELVEKKNQPLATVVAAMCLGIAIIVASAIH